MVYTLFFLIFARFNFGAFDFRALYFSPTLIFPLFAPLQFSRTLSQFAPFNFCAPPKKIKI